MVNPKFIVNFESKTTILKNWSSSVFFEGQKIIYFYLQVIKKQNSAFHSVSDREERKSDEKLRIWVQTSVLE